MHRLLPLLLLPLGGCFGDLFGGDDDDDTGPSIDELDVGERGDASSVWRPMAAEVSFMDYENPYASDVGAVQLPATQPGDDGREVEVFLQVDGDDTLVTWAYIDGDGFHWRVETPIVGSAEDGWVGATSTGTRILTFDEGHLVEQFTSQVGRVIVMATTTHGAVDGDFPPASWPTDRVDIPLDGGL